MDIKGFVSADRIRRGDSNPGSVFAVPGGVARNLAANLAGLGVQVELLGMVGFDAFGDQVLEDCRSRGIGTEGIYRCHEDSTGVYLSIQLSSGELDAAVAGMGLFDRLEEQLDEDRMTGWIKRIRQTGRLLLDANLPERVLEILISQAASDDVPVYIDPVSVAKAGRAVPFLELLDWIKPNILEFPVLFPAYAGSGLRQRLLDAAQHGEILPGICCNCAVTLGADGTVLLRPEIPAVRIPGFPVEIKDVSGAGDAFFSAFVAGLAAGCTPEDAALFGSAAAAETIGIKETVVNRLSAERLLHWQQVFDLHMKGTV